MADAALVLEIIASYDLRDPASLPILPRNFDAKPQALSGLRIGASVDFGYAAVSPAVRAAFSKAVDVLATCGAQLSADGPGARSRDPRTHV